MSSLQMMKIYPSHISVLDQTLLPSQTLYLDIKDIKSAYESIEKMKVRGAPLIAVVALEGLRIELRNYFNSHNIFNEKKEISKENEENNEKTSELIGLAQTKTFLKSNIDYIRKSRPTAVNLANDTEALWSEVNRYEGSLEGFYEVVASFVVKNFKEYEQACIDMSRKGADAILGLEKLKNKEKVSILTICNTGKLATPGPGTALGIIRELHSRNRLEKFYIPETRPYNQGSRLTAYEAVSDGLPGILISDSMAGSLMKDGKVDCVVVGADRVVKNGATANKIGTYSLAVLAQFHSIPFIVACPESTIDLSLPTGRHIVIEQRPPNELKKIGDLKIAPEGIDCWNPCFDVTPPSLIKKIITEKGEFAFEMVTDEWEMLSNEKLENYLKNKANLFGKEEKITISDIADGNLNLVYCVEGETRKICVKQALPYVKCVGPEWALSLKRNLFEGECLKYHGERCPAMVPKVYHYNDELALLIMEFMEEHIILRKELNNMKKIKDLGKRVGDFVAKTCFFSSGLHLKADVLREKMSFWNQNTLCSLTEQVIFSDPYVDSPLNHHTKPFLDDIAQEIKNNEELIIKISELRHKFISYKQSLIHADLHTGSIMIGPNDSMKVIDSEFAFYGPIGFDLGAFVANILLNYFSLRGQHPSNDPELAKQVENQENWLLDEVLSFWNGFREEWLNLWNNEEIRKGDDYKDILVNKNEKLFALIQNRYLKNVCRDMIGFAAAKMIRRIVGIAHVADLESIKNEEIRAKCERKALKLAMEMMINDEKYVELENLVRLAKKINDSDN